MVEFHEMLVERPQPVQTEHGLQHRLQLLILLVQGLQEEYESQVLRVGLGELPPLVHLALGASLELRQAFSELSFVFLVSLL